MRSNCAERAPDAEEQIAQVGRAVTVGNNLNLREPQIRIFELAVLPHCINPEEIWSSRPTGDEGLEKRQEKSQLESVHPVRRTSLRRLSGSAEEHEILDRADQRGRS